MSAEHPIDDEADEPRAWAPGDPDRRKASRSLLELTGTAADDHRVAHGEVAVEPPATKRRSGR